MRAFLLILKFFGGLILVFGLGISIIHIFKSDKYFK